MDPSDAAWPLIEEELAAAVRPVRFVEADPARGAAALAAMDGISERSALGALLLHCGSLVVDEWLSVLGAGPDAAPGLPELNSSYGVAGGLVVGLDLLGGGFAINGGGLPEGDPGEVCYLAPDTLEWLATGMGHHAWVSWALTGRLEQFYEDLRWPHWRTDAAGLLPARALAVYPPVWSREYGHESASRRSVPVHEAWSVLVSTAQQAGQR